MSPAPVFVRISGSHHPGFRDPGSVLILGQVTQYGNPYLTCITTSRNTRWMDIHDIFRIWTQEAIRYIVSRWSRLFHALQTRRGGGLRSRNVSCWYMKFTPKDDKTVPNTQSISIAQLKIKFKWKTCCFIVPLHAASKISYLDNIY